ncbi:MAG: hypothetical protein LBF62_09715 [Tannerellaceae bacterium]|jgi:hypothetical protein|nr:hypothetical protein [Tannerellaceae bacterium]
MKTYLNKMVLCIACFGLFFFFSCNGLLEVEENGLGVEHAGSAHLAVGLPADGQTKASDADIKLQTTARLLSGIVNADVAKEIKRGVEKSLSYGLDEEVRFIEIIQPQNAKVNKFSGANLLTGNLKETICNIGKSSLASVPFTGNDMESFLCKGDVQIYWPYSENWDGKEIPVITYGRYDGEDDDVSDVVAYRRTKDSFGKEKIESLIVNEEYAKKHPVWVINRNNIPYSDLPDFNDNMFEKNGVWFYSEKANAVSSSEVSLRASSSASVFKLVSVKCTKQYDSWIAGGSEFRFSNAFLTPPWYNYYQYEATTNISISREGASKPAHPLFLNQTVRIRNIFLILPGN